MKVRYEKLLKKLPNFIFWRSIQLLVGMSSLAWQFLPKSNCTAPFVELKESPLLATCEFFFYPNSDILAPSDWFNFGWNLRRKKNRCLWRKYFLSQSTRTQKETSNTLDPHIITLFQGYCLYLAIEEIIQMHRVQKKRSHEIYSLG